LAIGRSFPATTRFRSRGDRRLDFLNHLSHPFGEALEQRSHLLIGGSSRQPSTIACLRSKLLKLSNEFFHSRCSAPRIFQELFSGDLPAGHLGNFPVSQAY
jgi:hypothetical protein